jgi:hypothetical protein
MPAQQHAFAAADEIWMLGSKPVEMSALLPSGNGSLPIILCLPGLGETSAADAATGTVLQYMPPGQKYLMSLYDVPHALLGGAEALNGLLPIGWSASYTYLCPFPLLRDRPGVQRCRGRAGPIL